MEEVSGPTTYLTSGWALVAGLTLNEWVAVVSIIIAIASFIVNWWFQYHRFLLTLQASVRMGSTKGDESDG